MLLRRIAKAFRRQDWVTVFVEFALVVAGVLIALQVDNWASAALKRKHEKAALERLFFEAKAAQDELTFMLARTERLNQLRRAGVAFIDSDAPVPDQVIPLKIGINTMGQFPRLPIVRVVYDELTSSGQMQIIQSAEIRNRVASFHVDVAYFNELNAQFAAGSDTFWEAYRDHVIWRYNPDATDSDILLSTYDWESMRADRQFISIAIGYLRNQVVSEDSLRDLQTSASELCETLGRVVERSCTTEGDPE